VQSYGSKHPAKTRVQPWAEEARLANHPWFPEEDMGQILAFAGISMQDRIENRMMDFGMKSNC
jgi:hypothetical protein